jgi:Bacterial SH3 domain
MRLNDAACLEGGLMNFRRAGLSILSVGLVIFTLFCRPASAERGELIAKEAEAQINVRSLANTEADIIAAGAVGDQVEILEHSVGNDALIWYQVKLLKSGKVGWIRGDLIKILGNPTASATKLGISAKRSSVKSKSESAKGAKSNNPPITLAAPKPPASPKSVAPTKSASSSSTTAKSSASTAEHSSSKTATGPTGAEASASTITAFETPTYAVRVFSKSGQLRLNLYNRRTQAVALSAVPIQSKSNSDGTTYSYQGEVKVTVVVPASGQPTVSTSALGEDLTERPESAPAPKASTEAAPAPSSEAPARTAPAATPTATPAPTP